MASTVNSDDGVVSGIAGLKTSADNSGVLALQTNGTTAVTVNASQALGVGSTPSFGTSGQVLTSGGTSASPTWSTVAVTPAAVSDQNNTSTGYFDLPTGTTAERPASPTNGMIRFNTTLGFVEWYSSVLSMWLPLSDAPNYSVDFLIVAGGAGGGWDYGGGGGAGGAISSTSLVQLHLHIL